MTSGPPWQGRTISDSPIPRLLTTRPAVVLERIARGGGTTNWYHCADPTQLNAVTARLNPGSVVSFYFDDRIAYSRFTSDLRQQMLDLMDSLRGQPGETGEIVVGRLNADQLRIEVDFPSGPADLDEVTAHLGHHSWIYYGPYPGRDNDGINAVMPGAGSGGCSVDVSSESCTV